MTPTDVSHTPDRDIRTDPTGDLHTENGLDNVDEQHRNALFRAAEEVDTGLARPDLREELRIAIRQEVSSVPSVDRIIDISISIENSTTVRADVETDATVLSTEVNV